MKGTLSEIKKTQWVVKKQSRLNEERISELEESAEKTFQNEAYRKNLKRIFH